MADPWTHHSAVVNGFRMHYVIAGSGYPLVFLHGWPQSWYEWRKIIPASGGTVYHDCSRPARPGRLGATAGWL